MLIVDVFLAFFIATCVLVVARVVTTIVIFCVA
jgi:hypothetical protein